MELIDIIREIRDLARDIETDDEISDSALGHIYDLCECALIDYKVNKRLQIEPESTSITLPRT